MAINTGLPIFTAWSCIFAATDFWAVVSIYRSCDSYGTPASYCPSCAATHLCHRQTMSFKFLRRVNNAKILPYSSLLALSLRIIFGTNSAAHDNPDRSHGRRYGCCSARIHVFLIHRVAHFVAANAELSVLAFSIPVLKPPQKTMPPTNRSTAASPAPDGWGYATISTALNQTRLTVRISHNNLLFPEPFDGVKVFPTIGAVSACGTDIADRNNDAEPLPRPLCRRCHKVSRTDTRRASGAITFDTGHCKQRLVLVVT